MRYLHIFTLLIVILFIGCASQKALFEESVAINTIEAYRDFLRKYPTGEMADQIKLKLMALEYNEAITLNTILGYERFLQKYPNSEYNTTINERLTILKNEIAFLQAMAEKDYQQAEQLLQQGVKIDCTDKNGFTALIHAAQAGDMKAVTFLLNHDANINAEGMLGETPYLLANNDVMATYLVQKGAQQLEKSKYGVTPLMFAARHGRIDKMKALIKKGANVDEKDMQGVSAMHWAISPKSSTDALKVLLDNDAIINIKDADGKSPITYAIENGNTGAFKFLMSNGARFDLHSDAGFGYFHKAINNKNDDMVNYLLSNGPVTLPETVKPDFYIDTWNYFSALSKNKTTAQQLELLDPWLLHINYRLNSFEEKIFLTELFSWAAILHGRNNQNVRAAISNLTAGAVVHTTFEDIRSNLFSEALTGLGSKDGYGLFESLRRLEEKKQEIEQGYANIRKNRKFLHSLGVASLYLGTFDFMQTLAQTQSDDKEKSDQAIKNATEKVAQMVGTVDPYKERCVIILNDLFGEDKDCWPALQSFNLFPDKRPLENIVLMPRFYDYEHNIEEYLDKFKDESVALAQKWLNDDLSSSMKKSRAYFILGYHQVEYQKPQLTEAPSDEPESAPSEIDVDTPAGTRTLSLDVSGQRGTISKSEPKATEKPTTISEKTSTTKTTFDKEKNIFYDYYCLRLGLGNRKERLENLIEEAAKESRIALVLYNKVRGDDPVPRNLVTWLKKEISKEKYSDNEAIHVFLPLIAGLSEPEKATVMLFWCCAVRCPGKK